MGLLITKQTGNFFSIQLDSQDPIVSEQNRLTTVGNYCHFKTVSGANIIKDQNVLYSDVTLVASGTFNFASANSLWVKLIEVGFFDGLSAGSSGGTGVDHFTELTDTFNSYLGRNGQALVVNESQQKIESVPFSNVSAFTQLSDAPNPLLPNKMIVTNSAGTALIMTDLPSEPQQYLNAVGSFHYSDYVTQTTPIAVLSNVESKLTNDTLGDNTITSNAPYGVSSVWNSTTNQFDFSQLSVGDLVKIRPDLNIDLVGTNTSYKVYMKMAIGSGSEWTLTMLNSERKSTDEFNDAHLIGFDIANSETKDYPSEIYILTDANATVKVNGWYVEILRKNINIIGTFDILKEDVINKVNVYTVDGTGTKYYTVDYINSVISSLSGLGKIQFTADGLANTFDIGVSSEITAVFWNGVALNDSDWSQSGSIITLTFVPELNDIIKPI